MSDNITPVRAQESGGVCRPAHLVSRKYIEAQESAVKSAAHLVSSAFNKLIPPKVQAQESAVKSAAHLVSSTKNPSLYQTPIPHQQKIVDFQKLKDFWGYEEEDLEEVTQAMNKGKVYFLDEDEDEGLILPTINASSAWIPLADKTYECDCLEHPHAPGKDVGRMQPVSYASIVGKEYEPQGGTMFESNNIGISDNLYLPSGELRLTNSILAPPEVFQYSEMPVNINCTNDNLPQQIENACLNMCVGWKENQVWVLDSNQQFSKQIGKKCRCGGFVVPKAAVLDSPCFCFMNKYHNTNVLPQNDYSSIVVNSPGFRLNSSHLWKVQVVPRPCGFRGRTRVFSLKPGSWITEAVAMYGCAGFSFSNNALIHLVQYLTHYVQINGPIHPNICLQLSYLITRMPNARIALIKMLKPRKLSTKDEYIDAGCLVHFKPKFTVVKNLPLWEWKQEHEYVDEMPNIDKPAEFHCQLCNITTTSQQLLDLHFDGKKHKKAQAFVPEEYACELCKKNCISEDQLKQHKFTDKHKKLEEFPAQGLSTVKDVAESVYETTLKFVNVAINSDILQKMYTLLGGKGKITRKEREYVLLITTNLINAGWCTIPNSLLVQAIYSQYVRSEITRAMQFLQLVASIYACVNGSATTIEEYEAQGIPSNIFSALKLLTPGLNNDTECVKMVNELRAASLARNTLKDYWAFARDLYVWVVDKTYEYLIETPQDLQVWVDAVDNIEEVVMEEQSSTTLRVQITKFQEYRRKLYQLKKQGTVIKKKLESLGKNSFHLKILNERVKKLEKILAQNTGAFVGSQRKFKPHVIYLHGQPEVGKSVMVDHLYSDLFQVLGEEDYLPGVDRHTLNPMDEFYDSYQYNRVVDIQDLFQIKQAETRTQELYSLIHMADETPYSLKIAECSGKGSTFFCSEHMLLTSNFDLDNQATAIESLITSFEAVNRRINVYAEVFRKKITVNKFDRSLMSFKVRQVEKTKSSEGWTHKHVTLDWYEFVKHCAKSVITNRQRSEGVMDLAKDEEVVRHLLTLKETIHAEEFVAQSNVKVTMKEKIAALVEYMTPTWRDKLGSYLQCGLSSIGWGNMKAAKWRAACYEMQELCATTIGSILNFAVDWFEVFALGAGLCALLYNVKKPALTVYAEEGMGNLSGGVRETVNMRKKNLRFQPESGFGNLSGGVRETAQARKKTKRFRPESKPLTSFLAEGCMASNMQQVRAVCTRNLGRVCGVKMATHCFGLFGHVIAIPEHVVQTKEDMLHVTVFGNVSRQFKLADVPHKVLSAHHLIVLDLSEQLANYAPFSDITRRVWKDQTQMSTQGLVVTSRTGMTGFDYWGIALEDMKKLDSTVAIKMKTGDRFCFSQGMVAFGATENGDCGAPWILDTQEGAHIVALHAGGTNHQKCTASLLTRELLAHLKENFHEKTVEPVEYEAAGTEFDPPEDNMTVDVKGVTEAYVFQPRKTKIVPSPFTGIIPQRTAPAILKPIVVQNREGLFVKHSPLVLNFEKNFISKKQFSIQQVNRGLNLLADWYLPSGLGQDKRQVLTLEQAVFGDSQDPRNDSVNGKAGIGWPWMEQFQSRKQLLDLENKTIHPELRKACEQLITAESCDQEFLFVDMLKDERLPLEKVAALKTRVFTILPIHVNIVLKQLFGHFVMYLMEKHISCPAKIGISQKPNDWTELYNFLNNGGEFIAGDYSAFDKCMHFEMMEGVGRMANEFYDDDYADLRLKLLKKVFCSYRLIDGVVYQTFGGMPSGCYLTASFNSMVNALYWFVFLAESVENTENHKQWFRPATFGDDHVVAVFQHPDINQVTFAAWLRNYGMKYTTATKGEVEEPYTPFSEVTFLKRSFRFDGVRYWGPLDLMTIVDSAQWYRTSAIMKALTPTELTNEIFSNIQLELVHHGKEVFDEWSQKLSEYVRYDLTISRRSFGKVQKIFLETNLTTYLPTNMNDSQKDYENFSALSKACAEDYEIEFEVQGDDIAPPQEKETVLGTSMVEDSWQGLTHFTEQIDSSVAQSIAPLNAPIDDMFEIPAGFFKMCLRWLLIGKRTVVTGDPSGGPILRIDPMNFLIEDPFIREKIASTTFVRYEMEIQLKVVATKFHYGAYIIVWRPYYAAGQTALAYFTANEPDGEILICAPAPSGKRQYSAYDTIFTASQCAHTTMSLTAKNTIKIPISWNIPYQYVPTASMTDPRYHPGFLDIYKITPTGPEDIDPPEFAIFAAFTKIRGWGYKSEANPPRKLVYVNSSQGTWASIRKSTWSVSVPVMPSIALDPVLWSRSELSRKKLDVFEAQGLDTKSETEQQTTGSWLMDTAHWILDTSKSVLTLFTPLGPLLGFFGLSRPADATPIARMMLANIPMSNALGPDCCYSTAMNPYNLLEADATPEEKLITSVAATPIYLGWFKFSNTDPDTRMFSFSPMHVHPVGNHTALMPAGYIVNRFRFWRSAIRMHIRFFSSSFVSVRVAVFITYNDVGGRVGLVPTRVIDVNGDNECDIELPFLFQTPWYDTSSGYDFANMFNVTIQQVTDIVSDEATEGKPVFCTMWTSFPGLQVSGPCAMKVATDSFTFKPAMTYDAQCEEYDVQGDDLPGLGTCSNQNGVKWAMNDVPASLYHLAKRYQPAKAVSLFPYLVPSSKGKSTASEEDVYINDAPDYQYYAMLYRFYRCSINVISKNTKCIENVAGYGESFRDGTAIKDLFLSTDPFTLGTMGVTNARIPFRSGVNYLPSPTFGFSSAVTTTVDSDGNLVTYDVTGVSWANSLDETSYGTRIGTQCVAAPDNEKNDLYLAAADDLDYHTFIGTPLVRPVNLPEWSASFKKITP